VADIIVTCEHSSKLIPEDFVKRMAVPADIQMHRVYDKGALGAALAFAEKHGADVFDFPVSRLLVDANRSISNRRIFSEYTMKLSALERYELLQKYYMPFRMKVMEKILLSQKVIHLSFHSFTDNYNGNIRDFDVGVLYDPKRGGERKISASIIDSLKKAGVHVLSNRPYRGTADGHTTALRREFDDEKYAGIEIEFSQRLSEEKMKSFSAVLRVY